MAKQSKKNKGATSTKPPKETKVSKPAEEEEDEPEEIWDIERVVSSKEGLACRSEGCKEHAVAIWASNLEPEDKWPMCEDCQLEDFGGWPEGVEPIDSDVEEDDDETPETVCDQVPPAKPAKETSSDETKDKDHQSCNEDDKSDGTPAVIDEAEEDDGGSKTAQPDEEKDELSSMSPAGMEEPIAEPPKDTDTLVDASTTTIEDPPVDADAVVDVPTVNTEEVASTPAKTNPAAPMELDTNKEEVDTPDGDGDDAEDEAEIWDLKKILPHDDIIKEATIKCSTEDCILPACSIWISNLAPTTKWYTCIDCQEADFEGWPDLDELPIKYIEPEHMLAIAEKCSKQKAPVMPTFPTLPSSPSQQTSGGKSNFVTPPPNRLGGKVAQQDAAGKAILSETANKITPAPSGNPAKPAKPAKPSAGALAMHKKWQEAAEAMGGKDVRIVVSKLAAKKLIFDLLYEAFCPMNITQVYKGLKAIVPSPVLSTCLQDMACNHDDKNPFDGSDDEEENFEQKPTKAEPYAASLLFKPGRNASSNLYYVDHTKIKGMDPEERNILASKNAVARGEDANLRALLKTTIETEKRLLSEPTNEEAALRLTNEEAAMEKLEAQRAEAQALKVNEKHRKRTKEKVQHMVGQWRKRKRMCTEFLVGLEENTDGSISAKKCFAGDGPIALDSDEAVAKAAVQRAKEKKNSRRPLLGGGKKRKIAGKSMSKSNPIDSLSDPSFVAVLLDSQHNVRRVHVDEE